MFAVGCFGQRITQSITCLCIVSRSLNIRMFKGDAVDNGFGRIEDYLNGTREGLDFDYNVDEKATSLLESIGLTGARSEHESGSGRSSNLEHDVDEKPMCVLESLGLTGANNENDIHLRKSLNRDHNMEEKSMSILESLGLAGANGEHENHLRKKSSSTESFFKNIRSEARKILEILQQDGQGYDTDTALDHLQVRISGLLVREVLLGIMKTINCLNKSQWAKLGYKFFIWSGNQQNYRHTANAYHLILKIFAEAEEFKAMWRLVDEMIEKGYPTTARTFNIMICTCGEAGLARKVVERFIKSKTFNYRPFKHSFNAILHSLLVVNRYRLIEWVYQQMLVEGHSPDILTYNILLCAKYRLGKLDQFHRLLDEMGRDGFAPDFHTYNLLLHVLGKGDKPLAALNLLNHMKQVGCDPSVIHFTTLIDGLSRAGNLDACKYFFDEMVKQGCMPDVVCYTVMITGYVVAGEIDKAQEQFTEMIRKGQMPNVFTYNSMIRGLCMAGKFEEAYMMLKEMESRGCNPNFLVYSTLVSYLRNAGKLDKAHQVIRNMVEKGKYTHLVSKIKKHRRC